VIVNISISRDGIEIGEWTEEEVRSFYKEGRLVDTDYFWRQGMTEWTPLSSLIRPAPPFPATSTLVAEPNVPLRLTDCATSGRTASSDPAALPITIQDQVLVPNVPEEFLAVAPRPVTSISDSSPRAVVQESAVSSSKATNSTSSALSNNT